MIDRIIEKIEREKLIAFETLANTGDEKFDFAYLKVGNYADKAIDIVKQVAEEGGWIKRSDRLPEKHSFEKVLVSIKSENGDTVRIGVKSLGPWYVDGYPIKEYDEVGEVVAWQPIPKPFKEATDDR